jgi:hypothetical protein
LLGHFQVLKFGVDALLVPFNLPAEFTLVGFLLVGITNGKSKILSSDVAVVSSVVNCYAGVVLNVNFISPLSVGFQDTVFRRLRVVPFERSSDALIDRVDLLLTIDLNRRTVVAVF